MDEPLFELHGQDGHKWLIYENGEAIGFPDGTVIVNRARPLLDAFRCLAREKLLPTTGVSDIKGEVGN